MNNQLFSNERYRANPALGSGPGSRGYPAWVKRQLICQAVAQNGLHSVIDAGCGDLCWMQEGLLPGVNYLGLDISDVIVAQNRTRYPDLAFLHHDLATGPVQPPADLIVSFDVLIHQCSLELFSAVLRNIVQSTRRWALISYLTPEGETLPDRRLAERLQAEMPAEVHAAEAAFQAAFSTLGAETPRAATANYGALPNLLRQLEIPVAVRPLARYRANTIYELTRDGSWLRWE